jgi:adenylosuccinate lyase
MGNFDFVKSSGILDSKLEALSLLEIIMTEHQPHIETVDQGKYNEMPEMAKREKEYRAQVLCRKAKIKRKMEEDRRIFHHRFTSYST